MPRRSIASATSIPSHTPLHPEVERLMRLLAGVYVRLAHEDGVIGGPTLASASPSVTQDTARIPTRRKGGMADGQKDRSKTAPRKRRAVPTAPLPTR